MSQPAPILPNIPPFTMSTAVLAGELPPTPAGKAAPEWIKVTPRGRVQTRDGRSYAFDPETLVSRFKADGVDVPVDRNHAIALRGSRGQEDAGAIGWAKELEARPDGTYARIAWLPPGAATLAAGTHRYVSPSVPADAAGNATWLHSISLVSAPAMSMPAVFSAGAGSAEPNTIAEALGLDPAADDAACLAAIVALRAEFIPIGLFNDAVATLSAANGTIAELRSTARRERVTALIEGALKARKIAPAQRAQYEALCATDAGLTHVATLFANTVPGLQPSGLDQRQPTGGEAEPPETLAARAARYRATEAAGGRALTHAEAIRFVHENPAAGR